MTSSLIACSPVALASPLFELVGSSVGTGGLNARANGPSAASAYFNPALLPQAKQGLDVGVLMLNDAISITLDARSNRVDVPVSAVNRVNTDLPPYPTEWIERGCTQGPEGACTRDVPAHPRQGDGSSNEVRAYQVLGLVNHLWGEYLSLGFYALVPLSSFTRAHSFFVDEREQYFSNSLHPELYSDRLTPVSLAFGAGSRVLDWLSIGLSFTLGLQNSANAGAYVGNSRKLDETLQLSTQVDVSANVSPHGSVLIEPIDALDISFTLHSPQKMVIDTAFGIYLPDGDIQLASRPATHAYLPWIVGLGTTYELWKNERHAWAATGTLTYERWSKYLNRQTERPQRDYEWHDIIVGTAGGRYTFEDKLAAFVDANYRPSPVPLQTGRTNYVDNNRYGLSGGMSYDVPIPRWNVAFRFAGQGQMHFLQKRHQTKYDPTRPELAGRKYSQLVTDEWPDDTKDTSTGVVIPEAKGLQTNNPGWPGFASRGLILGGGLSVSLLY